MSLPRRLLATFSAVTPIRFGNGAGVVLDFDPQRRLFDAERIEDFADLGPSLTVPAVLGLSKVLRILRIARIAAPADPRILVGRERQAAGLLERALGTPLRIGVRTRSRVRFVAWTEAGVEAVDDVADVIESSDAYYVVRRGARVPVRIPRESVVRRHTEALRWHQVVEIERVV